MDGNETKRRGRPRKVVDEHSPIGDGEGAAALGGADGQSRQGQPRAQIQGWSQALGIIDALSDDVVLTLIVVPFADHPNLYTRGHYGAPVITGDSFSARTAEGQTLIF